MEIPCQIAARLPAIIKNHLVRDQYKEFVEILYCKPKDEEILASLFTILGPTLISSPMPPSKTKKKKKVPTKTSVLRFKVDVQYQLNATKKQKEESVIVID